MAEFNNGLILHVRDHKNASYTAYVDPFREIQWEKIFQLFFSTIESDNLKYEVQIGFIHVANSLNFALIKHTLSRLTRSLQIYLKNKSLAVNFTAVYQMVDKNQLDAANCANILVGITKGTFAICKPINQCYYPFFLTPMDKGALSIRLFDYTNDRALVLIFNRNAPACSNDAFLRYCSQYSPVYLKALSTYRQGDSYDLHFIVDYFKDCLSKLLGSNETAQQYFDENLIFYLRNATALFTAIKIYSTLISKPTETVSPKLVAKASRRRSSETDFSIPQVRNKLAAEQC